MLASPVFDKLEIKEDFTTFLDNLRYRELELKPLGKTKFKNSAFIDLPEYCVENYEQIDPFLPQNYKKEI